MPAIAACAHLPHGCCRVGDIEERLSTTELFMRHPAEADAFQSQLHSAPDCERLLARAANVLAAVVDQVAAAEEGDQAAEQAQQGRGWAAPHGQPQQQGQSAASRWASPNPCPVPAAGKRAEEGSRVERLAAVLDLSQVGCLWRGGAPGLPTQTLLLEQASRFIIIPAAHCTPSLSRWRCPVLLLPACRPPSCPW